MILDLGLSQVETDFADKDLMVVMILSVFSVLAFCLCCRLLMNAVRQPVRAGVSRTYNCGALRVKKIYMIFAWSLMTGAFLFALVGSFVQVYTTL